ncbi:hypothetical protein FRC09_001959 [Ceratobasidium sp. 395]|nr:hypothetical protein FRC09_001959 [Ceratobasidium sp. 395]
MPPHRLVPPVGRGRSQSHRDLARHTLTSSARTTSNNPSRIVAHPYARPRSPPAPHAADHDERIRSIIGHSLAKRTADNYASATTAFKKFCEENGYTALPADDFTICAFAASLAETMAGTSIANMVSGIRYWHIANGHNWLESQRLRSLLKGAARVAPPSSSLPKRDPVSVNMLEALHRRLHDGNSEDRAVLAAALLAFSSLLRLGEILGSSSRKFDPKQFPSRSSLGPPISANGARLLQLPRTKTSQIHGEQVLVSPQHSVIDPIRALNAHLHATRSFDGNAHLFTYTHNRSGQQKILTHEFFLKRCNDIWTSEGLANITGHSFRIGGTTHFLKSGVAPDVVKAMGRWSSDAFMRYWRDTHIIASNHIEAAGQLPATLAPREAATGPRPRRHPVRTGHLGGRPRPAVVADVSTSRRARAPPLHRLLRIR